MNMGFSNSIYNLVEWSWTQHWNPKRLLWIRKKALCPHDLYLTAAVAPEPKQAAIRCVLFWFCPFEFSSRELFVWLLLCRDPAFPSLVCSQTRVLREGLFLIAGLCLSFMQVILICLDKRRAKSGLSESMWTTTVCPVSCMFNNFILDSLSKFMRKFVFSVQGAAKFMVRCELVTYGVKE